MLLTVDSARVFCSGSLSRWQGPPRERATQTKAKEAKSNMSYPATLPNIGSTLAEEIDDEIARARKKFPANANLMAALARAEAEAKAKEAADA